jgi:nitrogenase molybdenum-iron protein alpha/beta subunit
MKQTVARISTYSADTFGVCSALFELGGMTVIHDPSGCNSTYTTHDEPRWFDMDSLLFISGLTEVDAIMGNDDKLVHDVVAAAKDFSPRFITILSTPIPYMTGTDMPAVAQMIEEQCGIPTYTLPTNSMHYYVHGISKALALLAEHMVAEPGNEELPPLTPKRWCCSWKADYAAQGSMLKAEAPIVEDKPISVNIIGVTPLDFSYNGSDKSLVRAIRERGFRVLGTWAMGTTLEDIAKAGLADVNLVVSAGGLEAAQVLQRRFGIPYVVGVPMGSKLASRVAGDLKQAAKERKNIVSYRSRSQEAADTVIIGESVYSASLAMAMETEWQHAAQVFCPLETAAGLLGAQDLTVESEAQLMELLGRYGTIIADPLYKPICPDSAKFVALPHEGFSGRLFRKDIPNLIGSFDAFRTAVED